MNKFKGGGKSGGFRREGGDRPPFQKKRWGDERGGGEREMTMHHATCDECGKDCEVPFRPTGEKPVYCRECFSGKRDAGGDHGRRDVPGAFGKRPGQDRFSTRSDGRLTSTSDDTRRQLAEISSKLDTLIGAIEKINLPKNAETKQTVSEPEKPILTPAKKEKVLSLKQVVAKVVKKKPAAKKKK